MSSAMRSLPTRSTGLGADMPLGVVPEPTPVSNFLRVPSLIRYMYSTAWLFGLL